MLQKSSKNKNYSGFSFIEVILAVFLISTGMIAVMSLMSSSLRDSMDSRDQIVGVLLSQEGIELVRNLRDNNWANDRDTFDTDIIYSGFPLSSADNCRIHSGSIISCGGSYVLSFGSSDNDYNHSSGTPTKFQRRIQVDYYGADKNSAEITSIVIWGGIFPASLNNCNSSAKCAYTKTILTRWGGM
ncbi:MAG: hypothetical protein WA055_03605 [Candidatus Moraniibacteriota bacterium]